MLRSAMPAADELRLRFETLGTAERRLVLFDSPRPLPIGTERMAISDDAFLKRAKPMIRYAQAHEMKMERLFQGERDAKTGGSVMRDLIEQRSGTQRWDGVGPARLRYDGSTGEKQHPQSHAPYDQPEEAKAQPEEARSTANGKDSRKRSSLHHRSEISGIFTQEAVAPAVPRHRFAGRASQTTVDLSGSSPPHAFTGPDGTPRKLCPHAGRRSYSHMTTSLTFEEPAQVEPLLRCCCFAAACLSCDLLSPGSHRFGTFRA